MQDSLEEGTFLLAEEGTALPVADTEPQLGTELVVVEGSQAGRKVAFNRKK